MRKNKIGVIFLIISLVFLLVPTSLTITGNVIAENFDAQFNLMYFLSLIFFIFSFIVFVSKQSLDAIIVPTSSSHEEDIERADKSAREKSKLKDHGYFIISGYIGRSEEGSGLYKGSQTQDIYEELRKQGIDPRKIKIEPQARNTIENVVYSLKRIKKRGGRDVGIVSYPGHLRRFEDIIKRAKEEEIVDKDFRIHRIPTRYKEKTGEKVYEALSRVLQRYKLRHGVEEALKSEDDPVVKTIKRIKRGLVSLIPRKKK